MNGFIKKTITALVAGSALVAAAAPADAQRFRGGGYYGRGYYGHYHGGRTGLAIGAGLLGLGVGAAIASSSRPYYGGGYYAGPRYYGGPAYYDDGYYGGGYRECTTHRVWDPYIGRYVSNSSCY